MAIIGNIPYFQTNPDGESTYFIPLKVPAPISLICLRRAEIHSQAESPSKTREEIWRR